MDTTFKSYITSNLESFKVTDVVLRLFLALFITPYFSTICTIGEIS